jgi:hypothetical protein
MPKIYRSMNAENSHPMVGSDRNMLGVRVPPSKVVDIVPDDEGYVKPEGKGLSVCSSISAISAISIVLIPRHYRQKNKIYKDARGQAPLEIFRMGEGEFVRADISAHLVLAPDNKHHVDHGVIEPVKRVLLEEYQSHLQATCNEWVLLKEPDGS